MNVTRYRKTVSSAVWLQLALVFCCTPHMVLRPLAFRQIKNGEFYIPLCTTTILIFFNSTLNPILYCCEIKWVRRAVKDILSYRWMWKIIFFWSRVLLTARVSGFSFDGCKKGGDWEPRPRGLLLSFLNSLIDINSMTESRFLKNQFLLTKKWQPNLR